MNKVRKTGGILTREDLESYSVITRPALQGTYLSRKVYTTHAPTSGPVLLHMLNIMEHYDLSEGMTDLNVHRLVEAIKCNYAHVISFSDFCTDIRQVGFSARTRVADPAFLDELNYLRKLPTKSYAAKVVVNITDVGF